MVLVAGCSAMPVQGPTVREIDDNSARNTSFAVVKLSPAVIGEINSIKGPSFIETFGSRAPAPTRTLNPGDIISVTLWEAGAGPPSTDGTVSAGIQTTTVPQQLVDQAGDITVPFVGQIHAAGKTTVEVQRAIVRGLQGQTVHPQALVTLVTDQSNLITVLDAIAHAGGSNQPAFDTVVQLTRNGRDKRVRMSQLLSHPGENIYLQPDDLVYVLHAPEYVAVLGATKNNMQLEFDTERLTLAEVIGKSGGLLDVQAEPRGVYVFRLEPAPVVEALTHGKMAKSSPSALVPVIYQDNMRDPKGLFLAQSFEMRNKDIVYVANTESVQIGKLLTLMLQTAGIIGIARGGSSVASP
jgi:polysaccharide export outer membrane protein